MYFILNLNKNNLNNPFKLQQYIKYRNIFTKTITNSKKVYNENILKNSYKNTSKILKIINNITYRRKIAIFQIN